MFLGGVRDSAFQLRYQRSEGLGPVLQNMIRDTLSYLSRRTARMTEQILFEGALRADITPVFDACKGVISIYIRNLRVVYAKISREKGVEIRLRCLHGTASGVNA